MNMPQAEFFCGIPQEPHQQEDWRERFRHQIYIFERHREWQPMCDLNFLVARWLRKKHKLTDVGFVHTVIFPEQLEIEMLAWTAHRAFHLTDPTNEGNAPSQLLLFTGSQKLVEWKRTHWERQHLWPKKAFMVHTCYQPNGEPMLERRLLTF